VRGGRLAALHPGGPVCSQELPGRGGAQGARAAAAHCPAGHPLSVQPAPAPSIAPRALLPRLLGAFGGGGGASLPPSLLFNARKGDASSSMHPRALLRAAVTPCRHVIELMLYALPAVLGCGEGERRRRSLLSGIDSPRSWGSAEIPAERQPSSFSQSFVLAYVWHRMKEEPGMLAMPFEFEEAHQALRRAGCPPDTMLVRTA